MLAFTKSKHCLRVFKERAVHAEVSLNSSVGYRRAEWKRAFSRLRLVIARFNITLPWMEFRFYLGEDRLNSSYLLLAMSEGKPDSIGSTSVTVMSSCWEARVCKDLTLELGEMKSVWVLTRTNFSSWLRLGGILKWQSPKGFVVLRWNIERLLHPRWTGLGVRQFWFSVDPKARP
jgi:hypothetical protein